MLGSLDDRLGLAAAAWVASVLRRPIPVITAISVVAFALALLAFFRLGLHTNENDLFSEDLPFVALRRDFNTNFPNLVDPIVVVVDGETIDLAEDAADALAAQLRASPDIFASVHRPGEGPFFERNGLLYLDTDELDDLLDSMFAVQPYLSRLSRDMSLHGFFSMLSDAAEASADGNLEDVDLTEVFARVNDVLVSLAETSPRALPWSDVISGRTSTRSDRRRFLLVQPITDYTGLAPAEESLVALYELVENLALPGVRVRVTGVQPLSYEEMNNVATQATLAGVASFLLVAGILVGGLGSGRLVLASLATLLVGLALTAGVATLTVGRLNLISVAFAVLFIGLSIDFAIHLCVRYRELLAQGMSEADALRRSAQSIGGSLALCATTTAIGFFAFAPTEYAGVAELGVIAGSGMFISLFTNLTLLPALIGAWVPRGNVALPPGRPPRIPGLLAVPVRSPRIVVACTVIAAAGSLAVLPRAHFDPNPLRMRDPSVDSVQVMDEMLEDGDAFPWNLNVLARDSASASEIAGRLEALSTVDEAVTLSSYVPSDQVENREALEDAAYLLLPTLTPTPRTALASDATRSAEALVVFEARLDDLLASEPDAELGAVAARLRDSVGRLLGADSGRFADLEGVLLGSLPERLRVLRASLAPDVVTEAGLPDSVTDLYVADDGRIRVEVYPTGNLDDRDVLERYVASVQELAPETFGEGLVILETGHAVVRSLVQALLTAAVLIAVLLLALWRSAADAALVGTPLALATGFTVASTVVLGIPFNFANVIVVPLLLGMGVDSGIHLVHRARSGGLPDGNLLRSSTARAVVLSALTTIASFGTLGFSSHRGLASLGQLLTLGLAMILVCNLVVLPSLVRLVGLRRDGDA